MTCPVCGRVYCDHTPEERGQTYEQMREDMRKDAERAQKQNESTDTSDKE